MKKIPHSVLLVCILALLTSNIALALGLGKTWTGTTSTDWATAGNWSPAGVPAATDAVTIPAAPTGNKFPVLTGTASKPLIIIRFAATTIAAGAMLTINASSSITIGDGTAAQATTFDNNGTITISTTDINQGASIVNNLNCTFNNNSGGIINISGSVGAYLLNNTGGTMNNKSNANITLMTGAVLTPDGTFNNAGTITNTGGEIYGDYSASQITNTGTGTVINNGTCDLFLTISGSVFTNSAGGTIGVNNQADCLTFSNGFTNQGTVSFDLSPGGKSCFPGPASGTVDGITE